MIGMQIIEAEVGTVIGQDAEGKDMIVTETEVVCNGRIMWVSPSVYAKIKTNAALKEEKADE